jgi:hypothetical protein
MAAMVNKADAVNRTWCSACLLVQKLGRQLEVKAGMAAEEGKEAMAVMEAQAAVYLYQ